MRRSPSDSFWDRFLAAEEMRAWGHDFNARGMMVSNQGQSDDLGRRRRLQFRQRPSDIVSSPLVSQHSKLPKRKASL